MTYREAATAADVIFVAATKYEWEAYVYGGMRMCNLINEWGGVELK